MEFIMDTLTGLNTWSVAFRIGLSALLGGFIGLERGHHGRAAGLRTHILVCLGAAISSLIGLYAALELGFNNDPLRVGAQVVSGVGFLGVGTIMIRNRAQVTGLTTAAGLWVTACIGLAVGIGFYWTAFLSFAILIIAMSLLGYLERGSKRKATYICYVEFTCVDKVKGFYNEIKPYTTSTDIVPARSGIPTHIGLEFRTKGSKNYSVLCEKAEENQNVMIAIPSQPQS